jgi:hypothetical protein
MAASVDAQKLRGRVRNAYVALYIIGGLTLLLGLVAELGRVQVLLQLFGSGWFVAVEGLVLLILGYFTMRGSMIALGVAIAIYALDAIASLGLGAISGLGLRLIVLFFLVRGFMALRELKRRGPAQGESRAAPGSPPFTS